MLGPLPALRVCGDATELLCDLRLVTRGRTVEPGSPKIVGQTGTMRECGSFIAQARMRIGLVEQS